MTGATKGELEAASLNALRAESERYAPLSQATGDWELPGKPSSPLFQPVTRPKSAVLRRQPVQRLCKTASKPAFKPLSPSPPLRLLYSPRLLPHSRPIVPNQVFLNGLPVRRFILHCEGNRSVAVQAVEPASTREEGKAREERVSFAPLHIGGRGQERRRVKVKLQIARVL